MEFYIFVTKQCNLNCIYCSTVTVQKTSQSETNLLDVKQTADFVVKNLDKERNNVVFYGGEPLLNQKWIRKFIDLTRNENLADALKYH